MSYQEFDTKFWFYGFTASTEVCKNLIVYSLILSCCCYTCCIRKKLRKTLNITVHQLNLYFLKVVMLRFLRMSWICREGALTTFCHI